MMVMHGFDCSGEGGSVELLTSSGGDGEEGSDIHKPLA